MKQLKQPILPQERLQYTIEDTAFLLSVSRRTIERLIEQGELQTIGQGKLKRITRESILRYMERNRNN